MILFLGVPCLVAAIAVNAGAPLYHRSHATAAGRAPGALTFDAKRERYTIALSAELDGSLGSLLGLSRTERRRRFRVREGEASDARCSIAHPDGTRGRVRGDRQTASTTVATSYATVGEFEGKGGRTTVACRFDPPRDLLGTPTETPLMVHAAVTTLRYVGWGLFVAVFVLDRRRVLLILRGTVSALGHDFHAELVLGGRGARVLDVEHGLEGRGGDGELREVGLARGHLLQLHPGPHDDADPAAGAVAAGPLDQLERRPAISGTPRMREATSRYQAGSPSGAKTKMATIITTSRKLVRSAGAAGRSAGRSRAPAARPPRRRRSPCARPRGTGTPAAGRAGGR